MQVIRSCSLQYAERRCIKQSVKSDAMEASKELGCREPVRTGNLSPHILTRAARIILYGPVDKHISSHHLAEKYCLEYRTIRVEFKDILQFSQAALPLRSRWELAEHVIRASLQPRMQAGHDPILDRHHARCLIYRLSGKSHRLEIVGEFRRFRVGQGVPIDFFAHQCDFGPILHRSSGKIRQSRARDPDTSDSSLFRRQDGQRDRVASPAKFFPICSLRSR